MYTNTIKTILNPSKKIIIFSPGGWRNSPGVFQPNCLRQGVGFARGSGTSNFGVDGPRERESLGKFSEASGISPDKDLGLVLAL